MIEVNCFQKEISSMHSSDLLPFADIEKFGLNTCLKKGHGKFKIKSQGQDEPDN